MFGISDTIVILILVIIILILVLAVIGCVRCLVRGGHRDQNLVGVLVTGNRQAGRERHRERERKEREQQNERDSRPARASVGQTSEWDGERERLQYVDLPPEDVPDRDRRKSSSRAGGRSRGTSGGLGERRRTRSRAHTRDAPPANGAALSAPGVPVSTGGSQQGATRRVAAPHVDVLHAPPPVAARRPVVSYSMLPPAPAGGERTAGSSNDQVPRPFAATQYDVVPTSPYDNVQSVLR